MGNGKAVLFKQTTCLNNVNTTYNLNAIYKTTCVFYTNTTRLAVKTVTEILLFSFAVFVTADGGHLGMLNCKKSKWLHAKFIVIQS